MQTKAFYDPAKPGFGLVLNYNDLGDAVFGTFYGFDQYGSKVWYTVQRAEVDSGSGVAHFTVLSTDTVGDGTFPIGAETATHEVGTMTVAPSTPPSSIAVAFAFAKTPQFHPNAPSQDWAGKLDQLY